MDNNMDSLKELDERHYQFVKDRNWQKHQSPKNLAMALTAEVGELVEHFQWLSREESWTINGKRKEAVAEEMADCLIYLTRMAGELDIDLVAAAHEKCERNERKYPVDEFQEGSRRPHEYKDKDKY